MLAGLGALLVIGGKIAKAIAESTPSQQSSAEERKRQMEQLTAEVDAQDVWAREWFMSGKDVPYSSSRRCYVCLEVVGKKGVLQANGYSCYCMKCHNEAARRHALGKLRLKPVLGLEFIE